ncbi:hypothetical protein ACP70R_003440 [Stipagrostis hirtigluma subsp. patula]
MAVILANCHGHGGDGGCHPCRRPPTSRADVTLASVEDGLEVEASCDSRIVADTHIAACADQVFDIVALPGGILGSVRLRESEILQRITVTQAEEKRLLVWCYLCRNSCCSNALGSSQEKKGAPF